MENKLIIKEIQTELDFQLSDSKVFGSLMEVTFKGLTPLVAKRAMLEAMMRGLKFTDFLQKNVYAIPFKEGYSLVTSIDYARKIGMRSGVCGKTAPIFEEKEGKVFSCEITIKRKINEYIGDFTAKVYFDEYYKSSKYPTLWDTKPRTMLAKVAEMHALRMSCPEELAQAYIEEEYQAEQSKNIEGEVLIEDKENEAIEKMQLCKDLKELREFWSNLDGQLKTDKVTQLKNELRDKYENQNI
jgi:hypothetical protein